MERSKSEVWTDLRKNLEAFVSLQENNRASRDELDARRIRIEILMAELDRKAA